MTGWRPISYFTLILVMLGISFYSVAQPYNSTMGRFQVDQKKGCAGLMINLTNLLAGNCTPGVPCLMTFGDGTPVQQNTFTHTYAAAGTYTLSVLYQSIGADNIVITVDANTQPTFEIYSCATNRGAVIRVFDNAYDQYVIDFTNDGTPEFVLPFSNNIITPTPFLYPAPPPTTFTASVRGRDVASADNCTAATQTFTPLTTPLPTPSITTLTSIDDENITLDFTTAPNILYRGEVAINNTTTFQLYKTLYGGTTTLAITDLKLDENFYCFRLGAFNPCTGTSTYSNIICTNRLVVTAQSDLVVVTSNTGTGGVVNYSITRNNTAYVTVAANPFNDTNVECKTDYCYRVTTNYGSGRTSTSLEKCVTSFSDAIPTAIDDVTGTVAADGATFTWTQDTQFVPVGYKVLRSSAGGPYFLHTVAPASPYLDNSYTTAGQYCYTIDYVDKCDNVSGAGIPICPVRLDGVMSQTNAISLSWSLYEGWKNGVNRYILDKFDLAGNLVGSTVPSGNSFLDDGPDPTNQYVRYVIRVVSNDATKPIAKSNELVFIKNANLYVPTAFTPNGDNLNDRFTVSGQFIVTMKIRIFDRWGVLLYSSEKQEPWDGNSTGKPMPPSTYVWKVDITDRAGRTFSEDGTVALIRN